MLSQVARLSPHNPPPCLLPAKTWLASPLRFCDLEKMWVPCREVGSLRRGSPESLAKEHMETSPLLTPAATGCHLCEGAVTAVALAAKGSWTTGTLPAVGCTGTRGGAHWVAVTWEA